MTELLPVMQVDRDAVQSFHRTMAARLMLDLKSPDRPKLGEDEGDAGTLVQAFARHRLATAEAASGAGEREAGWTYEYDSGAGWETHTVLNTPPNLPTKRAPTKHYGSPDIRNVRAFYYALASLPPATDPAMVTVPREPTEAMIAAWFDAPRPPEVDFRPAYRAMLAAAPTIPATGEAIRAVTAEMRRFMPNACGDWADKIDAALATEKGRKVAFYDEGGIDIRPGETLADRDRRIYEQGRHDALNDEPEAFI